MTKEGEGCENQDVEPWWEIDDGLSERATFGFT